MNFDELKNDWNSPRNNLPTEQQRALTEKFSRQMIRRQRFQTWWLIHTFVWLTLISGLAIGMIATGKANLTLEWGLVPLLLVPWAFAIHFLRRYQKPTTPVIRGELSVRDSLNAALVSNRTHQSHLKLVGVLFVLMIPLLVLMIQQLHAAGKVSARELTSMALFFGATLLVCGIGIAARYFGRLLPQQRQLDAVLAELTNEVSR